MNSAHSGGTLAGDVNARGHGGWAASVLIYIGFSAVVFLAQGSRPPLGSDHLSYFELADLIIASCPNQDFWRETNTIRFFGVLLAYLYGWTGSHVLSMKVVLAVFSVLYLVAAELFFRLFTNARWQAVLFALLSGFAVSFGFASWGITDSTALLPRTLVAPIVMMSMWFWFRYDGRPVKYLAFSFLVLGSLMHLSTFYAVGVLVTVEIWDFLMLRRMRVDRLVPAFLAGLLLACTFIFWLEYVGMSNKIISGHIPAMLRSIGLRVPSIETGTLTLCRMSESPAVADTAEMRATGQATPPAPAKVPELKADSTFATPPLVPKNGGGSKGGAALEISSAPLVATVTPEKAPTSLSAKEAWAVELSLRPWRNMPLPMVNVANALSSSALILLFAVAGMVAARRDGFTRVDRLMVAMFVAVPVFAFVPQTALWVLRSFTSVYPATLEEVRAISLIMIPALYFVLRLFRRILESRASHRRLKAGAVVVAVLALPLLMKNLPIRAREGILSTMMVLHVVDSGSVSNVTNARAALGISAGASPLYYSTQGVREWLARNSPPGARILTDRDDMILLRDRVILGPRQVAVNIYKPTPEETEIFLGTSRAMAAKDTERVKALAQSYDADFVVVAWRVDGAAFMDDLFSVIPVRRGQAWTRP
jgi:hypothetical protein